VIYAYLIAVSEELLADMAAGSGGLYLFAR
jgi:hypothetical protein